MEDTKYNIYIDPVCSLSGSNSSESKPTLTLKGSSDCELNELTSNLQELSIDVDGMVQELVKGYKRDTDLIRQDFIRNGIDSAVVKSQSHNTRRQPPPGFGIPKWPLTRLDNQSFANNHPVDLKVDPQAVTSENNVTKSTRRKRSVKENEDYCVFCYNNREEQETYLGHACRDEEGLVVCPKLSKYVCPYCQATGNMAHTKKYCPKKPIITPDDLQTMASPFSGHNGSGRNRISRGKRALRF